MSEKPILVGRIPSHRGDPRRPLDGPGTGRRLAKLSGLAYEEYLRNFERVNLVFRYSPRTTKDDERRRAERLTRRYRNRRIVLLGLDVAEAFRCGRRPILKWFYFNHLSIALMPHPSGLNRWYNRKRNVVRAERFLRSLL